MLNCRYHSFFFNDVTILHPCCIRFKRLTSLTIQCKNTISSARGTLKKIVKQHCNIKYQYFLNIEPSLRKIVNFRGSDTNNFIFISCERLYRRWYNKRIAIFLLLTIFLNNLSLLLFPRGKINFHILWVKTFILGISVLLIWLCRLIGALALVER